MEVAGPPLLANLEHVKEQLRRSSHGIAKLCYEHREWQRSIEGMLGIIEHSITNSTLLKMTPEDSEIKQLATSSPEQDAEGPRKTRSSSYNSTNSSASSHQRGQKHKLRPPSMPSVPGSELCKVPRPRSFRGSLLQSRNTVKQCPAGPLRKLLSDLLNPPVHDQKAPSSIQKARQFISKIVSSNWFEYASGFVIMLNVIAIGFEADLSLAGNEWESSSWFARSERIFLAIYCAEAILRAFGLGRTLLSDGWYIMDLYGSVFDCDRHGDFGCGPYAGQPIWHCELEKTLGGSGPTSFASLEGLPNGASFQDHLALGLWLFDLLADDFRHGRADFGVNLCV